MPFVEESVELRRITPWEQIGEDVKGVKSPKEILERTGLNWKVHKVALEGRLGNHKIRGKNFALVRDIDQEVFDEVPPKWQPIQNLEAFRFFSEFCRTTGIELTRAGSLKDGQLVWALARMPRDFFTIKKVDRVQSYLLFTNRHEYGSAMDIRLNPIRVFTKSTVPMPLESTSETVHRMGHMVGHEQRALNVTDADDIMAKARKRFADHKTKAMILTGAEYRSLSLKTYFRRLFPAMAREELVSAEGSKAYFRALELVEALPGAEVSPKSWWNAFCTVCYLCDSELGQQDPSRLHSAWYGPNKDRKRKAMELALDMAKKL